MGTPVTGDDENGKQFVKVKASDVTSITARILAELPVHDLTIEDPPIEDVIERTFQK